VLDLKHTAAWASSPSLLASHPLAVTAAGSFHTSAACRSWRAQRSG
jgi:hypothetical protein